MDLSVLVVVRDDRACRLPSASVDSAGDDEDQSGLIVDMGCSGLAAVEC
jgi:hypothetical protein